MKIHPGVPSYPKIYMSSYGYILIVLDELITAIQVVSLVQRQNLDLEVFVVGNFGRNNHFFNRDLMGLNVS